jgi:chemotaxis protein MotB
MIACQRSPSVRWSAELAVVGRHRARTQPHQPGLERWLLTYADLITLLMVFFVVLYSISKTDGGRMSELRASIQRAFNVEVLAGNDPARLHGKASDTVPGSALLGTREVPSDGLLENRLVSTMDELKDMLNQLPRPQQDRALVNVGAARDGFIISLAGNALFDSGKADLRPDGLLLLDALAQGLQPLANEVRIEGHTDNIPITTALYPSNWELSSARATNVARYLGEHGNVAPTRLIAAGFGENRPVAPNETRDGRARNRRVDIVVLSTPISGAEVASVRITPEAGQ